jgi:beta-galactosidase
VVWARAGRGVRELEEGFSFWVGRYRDGVVQAARHPSHLVGQEEEGVTLVRLDGRVAGVGTGAVGEMRFGFCLEAVGF